MSAPDVNDKTANDDVWLQYALMLAARAEADGEVPVGAVLVRDNEIVGEGWNQVINRADPTAHAEIQALRNAGHRLGNYRLPDTQLFVTLEPCIMCAGAIIHARVSTVIYGAMDPKAGACGSVFDILPSDRRFNHSTTCRRASPANSEHCADLLRQFFRKRR
ncbi:tRNA adenosine(34) deaminase TadA [Thiospirillum jenense]|uniref:tRNA-specific adenosine deaminase n=1 Tax=Thiospirillum jenense TaxID=1653858 RepID=A0A839HH66_9GAMM|nr:tRNA adenosine(34) deaminase TadA [Thiospirillum jenense]